MLKVQCSSLGLDAQVWVELYKFKLHKANHLNDTAPAMARLAPWRAALRSVCSVCCGWLGLLCTHPWGFHTTGDRIAQECGGTSNTMGLWGTWAGGVPGLGLQDSALPLTQGDELVTARHRHCKCALCVQ